MTADLLERGRGDAPCSSKTNRGSTKAATDNQRGTAPLGMEYRLSTANTIMLATTATSNNIEDQFSHSVKFGERGGR
jgi:hypothetical protein